MKFDIVIGNPPYNNDVYIPFVEMGHQISTLCSAFITPAKWQAKGDNENAKDKPNERFRQNIVHYMSKIVFYTDTCDIFDIAEWGGISYYILGKDKSSNINIRTISPRNSNIDSEYQEHDENTIILYNRNILTIIGKVGQLGEGFKQSLYVKNTDHGEKSIASQLGFKRQVFVGEQDRGQQEIPPYYVEVMQGEKICGYKKKSELFTQLNIDKWKCITSIIVSGQSRYKEDGTTQRYINIYAIKPNQVPKGSFPVLKYFDTEDEAKSFISYFNTSLIKFLFNLGICGTTLTKEFFRFIPDPMRYDHIFTNEELYKKYNLTDEEINIIESVIKERK